MTSQYKKAKRCRICGNKKLVPVLDLGKTPAANNFLKKQELYKREPLFPLTLSFCPRCSLAQLSHIVKAEFLFDKYKYLTSASKPLVEHFKTFAQKLAKKHLTAKRNLVVEFGSNDGVLLAELKPFAQVLGVDPADNIATIAKKERGVDTRIGFFGEKTATEILEKHGPAKLIVANNVVAHIDDIHDVFKGITVLLSDTGVFVSESHWVGNLVTDGGFDQIYHEHLCYFSLHSFSELTRRFGLVVTDVELVPIHGQSLRITVRKNGKPSARVKTLLNREKRMGLNSLRAFSQFAKKVEKNKKDLTTLLKKLTGQKKLIVGYGAPAKGNTLLNYFGIGPKIISYITDTTPLKQGKFTPGTHIPVASPGRLISETPDYVILLSWNYADAILKKETALRVRGVKFIIPVPKVKII